MMMEYMIKQGETPNGIEIKNLLLESIGDKLVMHNDIVLLLIAPMETLADTFGVDLKFCHVLGNILINTEDTDDVNDGIVALEVHHGNVEVDAQAGVLVGVQCQVGYHLGGEEGGGFEIKQGHHDEEGGVGQYRARLGPLQKVGGDLPVHIEGRESAGRHI